MKKNYRYPGAQPFRTSQQHIFFGRNQDIEALYSFLKVEKLVVLYSRSGLGKSSILNAGIVPLLRQGGHWDPIVVRFGAHSDAKEEGPLQETIDSVNQGVDKRSFIQDMLRGDRSLWFYLKNRQLTQPENKGFVLIFDQFEELFTYPRHEITAFKKGLSEALYATIPQRYLEVIEDQLDGQQTILNPAEMEALHRPLEIKVIMAIRSDRMHLLNELSDYLPEILSHNFELGALSREAAEDAIISPAYQKGEAFVSSSFDFSDEAIEKVLSYLTKNGQQEIESFQLQLLCQSLERKVIHEKLQMIGEHQITNLEDLYENYYENQIALLDNSEEQMAARRLIEEGLIFEEEERRLIVYEGQIQKNFGVSRELLGKLVDSHLIRSEPSLRGGYVYELSHDTLVAPILRAKAKRQVEERRRREQAMQAEREQELIQERKRRRRATLLAVVGFILFGIAAIASLIAVQQTRLARAAEQDAQQSLAQFQIAQAEKDRLRVEQLEQDAEIYATADELRLAIGKLQEALTIDSLNQEIRNKIENYEQRLRE